MVLFPHQMDIVDAVRQAFKRTRNVLLVSPTGSGKTVMFSYLCKAVTSKGNKVYILVHRDELIDQVSNTLAQFDVPHGFIAAGRPPTPYPVMVCSVFTLANRVQDYPQPEMLIIDEAHHATSGSTWARIFGFWKASFKLGVTATPIRLDGRDLSSHFDELIEGPSTGWLIKNGYLSRYTMYTPPVALGKLRMRMGDYAKADLSSAMDKPSVVGDAVEHFSRLAPTKRAIVFCVSLDHAAHTAEAFKAKGFTAARIDGGMDKKDRRRLVASFASGQTQVMTSCDLVSEGFDLPSIEVALMLRPTASMGLYLQQVGRALRTSPGKDRAIILDHAGNAGTHGLPDDDREWTLGGDASSKKKFTKSLSLRTCGQCYAANKLGAMKCVHCGWEWPIEAREIKHQDGELEEVGEDVVRLEKMQARREVGMAKGLEDLLSIEKQRGYKPGWALHVFNSRRRAA